MAPLVSVVLPVHNGGSYLAEAVASVLTQTHRNLELVVVDDHSTDGAVLALPAEDARLRTLRSHQRGVSAAFNTGLAASSGEFVARMDADDRSVPERLERQLALLQAHPSLGLAGGKVDFFSEDGVGQGNRVYRDWLNSLVSPEAISRAMFIESPIPNPTALFRREVIERLGGYSDPDWPEDYDLFLRADAAGIRMAKPDNVLLHWRDHPGRLTRRDSRYSLTNFQRAKIHYLVRARLPDRKLVIWGAGDTGKLTFDLLAAEGIDVTGFIDIHPRRIGGRKRGRPVWAMDEGIARDAFILAAVGARAARGRIRAYLERHGRDEGRDFLFVA